MLGFCCACSWFGVVVCLFRFDWFVWLVYFALVNVGLCLPLGLWVVFALNVGWSFVDDWFC